MGPRLKDWRARLEVVLNDPQPFAWGVSDCCQFAARCIHAMTGDQIGTQYQYRDEFHAGKILRAYGGVEGLATKHLGPSKAAVFAFPGDVMLVEAPWRTLGICVGHRVAVQGAKRIEYVPLSSALMAWSV